MVKLASPSLQIFTLFCQIFKKCVLYSLDLFFCTNHSIYATVTLCGVAELIASFLLGLKSPSAEGEPEHGPGV